MNRVQDIKILILEGHYSNSRDRNDFFLLSFLLPPNTSWKKYCFSNFWYVGYFEYTFKTNKVRGEEFEYVNQKLPYGNICGNICASKFFLLDIVGGK